MKLPLRLGTFLRLLPLQTISLHKNHNDNHPPWQPLQSAHLSSASAPHSHRLCYISISFQAIPTSPAHLVHMHMEEEGERGSAGRGERGRRDLKQKLVTSVISSFIGVSITARRCGLFYTSGDIKQLDGGGERRTLHCFLLGLIYVFSRKPDEGLLLSDALHHSGFSPTVWHKPSTLSIQSHACCCFSACFLGTYVLCQVRLSLLCWFIFI